MQAIKVFIKVCIVSIVLGSLVIVSIGCTEKNEDKKKGPKTEVTEKNEAKLSNEIEVILEKKIELIKKLSKDSLIINATRESNRKNRNLSTGDIKKLDTRWRNAEGIDGFIKPFLTNECAQSLVDYQEKHDGFPEIFITGKKGLNVGQTNKTSDYYQADEGWWVEAYNNGQGKSYHGEIEYDESAMAEAIPIYVPIMDPETQKAIGVIKAVCDITEIKMEL